MHSQLMGDSVALDVLEHEHDVIRKAAAGMEALAARLESGRTVDVNLLNGVVEFLRVYGRACHQRKEEDLLFPALARRGVPSVGKPLGSLTFEHLKEWAAVGALAGAIRSYAAGDRDAPARVIALLREMAHFYTDHAWNESNLLFPYAARVLTPIDQAELLAQFEIVDREIGKDVVERLARFGEKLAEEAA
ncbi:MAG TPA: hemerythrin domain-containing protein [Bryobacteraceae bacterium]|nr:hemerythrin domain-containing protein [Bryobacteraceae bacterium]